MDKKDFIFEQEFMSIWEVLIDSDLARPWIDKTLAYLLLNYQHWINTLFKGNFKILFFDKRNGVGRGAVNFKLSDIIIF